MRKVYRHRTVGIIEPGVYFGHSANVNDEPQASEYNFAVFSGSKLIVPQRADLIEQILAPVLDTHRLKIANLGDSGLCYTIVNFRTQWDPNALRERWSAVGNSHLTQVGELTPELGKNLAFIQKRFRKSIETI